MNYGCLNWCRGEDPEFQTHWKDLFLISRNKVFSEEVLWLFLCIYKEYRQSDVLQGICALMIQGNCMDEDCHPYYEEALQRGVQLIGLQEAF